MAEDTVVAPKLKAVTKEQMAEALKKKPTETPAETPTVIPNKEDKPPIVATEKPAIKPEEKGAEAKVDKDGNVIKEQPPKTKRELKTFTPTAKKEAPTPEGEIPELIKAKITEYEKTIAELKGKIKVYDEDSGFQLLSEARKAGKDAWDLFEQVKGEDVTKLTDNQLYELELRKSGVKDAKDLEKDSEETSLEEEMQKFKDLPKLVRNEQIEKIRQKYNEANKNKAGDFFNKLKARNEEAEKVSKAEAIKQRDQAIQTQKDWDAYCDSYVGQEHLTVVGTPQMAESLKNVLRNPQGIFLKTDGTLDINKFFKAAHFLLFEDLMLENLENQYKAEGFNEAKEQFEITGAAKSNLIRTPSGGGASDDGKPPALKPISTGHPSVRVN